MAFREPGDGSIVMGIQWYQEPGMRDSWIVLDRLLWRRDDKEGHWSPADPQHWWSYYHDRWQSWRAVCEIADDLGLRLTASTNFHPLVEVEEEPRFAQVYEIRPRQGGRTRQMKEQGS